MLRMLPSPRPGVDASLARPDRHVLGPEVARGLPAAANFVRDQRCRPARHPHATTASDETASPDPCPGSAAASRRTGRAAWARTAGRRPPGPPLPAATSARVARLAVRRDAPAGRLAIRLVVVHGVTVHGDLLVHGLADAVQAAEWPVVLDRVPRRERRGSRRMCCAPACRTPGAGCGCRRRGRTATATPASAPSGSSIGMLRCGSCSCTRNSKQPSDWPRCSARPRRR